MNYQLHHRLVAGDVAVSELYQKTKMTKLTDTSDVFRAKARKCGCMNPVNNVYQQELEIIFDWIWVHTYMT